MVASSSASQMVMASADVNDQYGTSR